MAIGDYDPKSERPCPNPTCGHAVPHDFRYFDGEEAQGECRNCDCIEAERAIAELRAEVARLNDQLHQGAHLMDRAVVYSEISAEREKQDGRYGGPEHDDAHLHNDWIALIARYAGGAAAYPACTKTITAGDAARFRSGMVTVAALAVAAIESVDRKHADETGARA